MRQLTAHGWVESRGRSRSHRCGSGCSHSCRTLGSASEFGADSGVNAFGTTRSPAPPAGVENFQNSGRKKRKTPFTDTSGKPPRSTPGTPIHTGGMKTRLYNTWGKKVRREIDTAEKEKADGEDLPYNIPQKRGRRTRNGRTQYVDKEYLDFIMINRGRSIP